MTENKHGRDGKARHAPLVMRSELTMRGEERLGEPEGGDRKSEGGEAETDTTGRATLTREYEDRAEEGTRGAREARQRDPGCRALGRSGNRTSRRLYTPTRRREIKKTVKGKHSPIGHGAGRTRLGKVQPDNTEVGALRIPTDVHHPNPQSGLIKVTARQTNEKAGAGRRTIDLVHGPDVR